MRKNYFKILLQKRIPMITEQNSGNLSHQLGHHIWRIARTMTNELSLAMRGVAFFTGGLGFLLYTSPPLVAVAVVPLCSLAVMTRYYGSLLKIERDRMANIARSTQSYTQDRLSQIKTVKLFTAEGYEVNKYKELLDELFNKSMDVAKLSATHHSLIEGVTQNTVLWCIGYGAYLITINSGLCIGNLTAFAMYGMYSGMGFRLLLSGYTELKKVSGIYKQIYENAQLTDTETVSFSCAKFECNS